jgi:hypothetical protein
MVLPNRVARFIGGKYTKIPQNMRNEHKIYPMAIKYTK